MSITKWRVSIKDEKVDGAQPARPIARERKKGREGEREKSLPSEGHVG